MVDAPNRKRREPIRDEHKELPVPDDDCVEQSYYYDDAHGYEQFDPEADDGSNDDEDD